VSTVKHTCRWSKILDQKLGCLDTVDTNALMPWYENPHIHIHTPGEPVPEEKLLLDLMVQGKIT